MARDFADDSLLVAESRLTSEELRLARAYAGSFPDEIDSLIAENHLSPDEMRRRHPSIQHAEV